MKVLGRTNTITASNRPWHDFGSKILLAGKVGETVLSGLTDTQLNALTPIQSQTKAEENLTLAHNMLAGDPTAGTYNGHPNTPINISRWLIQRFTTSNPSAGYLYRVSEVYRQTNGNLGEVLKAILLDFEARSLQLADSSISHGRKKEPLIHFTSVMRGSRARSGLPITALRDVQHGFSDTDAQTLNGWPGYSKTLTQTEVDKYVPNATRFRFGDSTTALGQSPLRAPSVFNWFLPDYVVPGTMAEAGLFAPEMQIASETNLVNRINRLWTYTWMNLEGMVVQPGSDSGVDDVTQVTGNAAVQVKVGTGAAVPTAVGSYASAQTLTFTSTNWNTAQNIYVSAVDDSRREGPHTTTIAHTATSTDPNYNNPVLPSLTVNITDNEGPIGSVIIEESDGITVVAEHTTPATYQDTYTVRLSSAPTSTVSITTRANAQLSLSPATLSFNSGNWSTPQTVTVQAVNDSFSSELVHLGYIGHAVTSTDPAYGGIRAPDVVAFVGDNNPPTSGNYTLEIRHTYGNSTVVEGGDSDQFVVGLRRAPTGTVTVNIGTNSRVTRTPASLTFTTSNWQMPQVVTVTAVDDAIDNGSQNFNLVLTPSGGSYSTAANVPITVHDNDGVSAGGIVITETSGNTTVAEASPFSTANVDSYSIRLSSAPSQNVTVTVFPQRHVAPMSNHALQMGYFATHMPSSTSNMQKDRIIFDYAPEITLYTNTFLAAGGVSGTSSVNTAAHLAGVLAVVDRFDLMWCGGQLKAQWPTLTLADLSNESIVNPRKSIVAGLLYGYSTTVGTGTPNNIRDRVRVAAYLVSICPQSFTLK